MVKGDVSRGEVYYTNSTYLNVGTLLNPIDRVRKEGLFHPLIEAGSLTHIWLGESRPSKESLANFVIKVFRQSQNDQIAFSPEFTTCTTCATHRPRPEPPVSLLRLDRGGRDHPDHRLLHQDLQLEQGEAGELRDRHRSGEYFTAPAPGQSPLSIERGQPTAAGVTA